MTLAPAKDHDKKLNAFGIRGRILTGFTVITLIFILALGITLAIAFNTKNLANHVISKEMPAYDNLLDIDSEVYHLQLIIQKIIFISHSKVEDEELALIWKTIDKNQAIIDDLINEDPNSSYTKLWQEIKTLLIDIKSTQNKILNISDKKLQAQVLITELTPLIDKTTSRLNGTNNAINGSDSLLDMYSKQLNSGAHQILDNMNTIQITGYILAAVSILLSIAIAVFTARAITVIAKGITSACYNMLITLDEVRHAVDAQSSGASEQASSINEITSSLSEIEKSSSQTMEKTKSLGDNAERTSEKAQLGLTSVDQSVAGMKSVRDKVQVIAQTILDLSHQTQQVGEITTVVNNLAQQSKMLALNASIEAAKAGEAGKGFSVVAVEVKNLAEQSEQATIQVQKILENIRHAAEKAVMVTEEGTKGVDQGTELVEQTGDIIRNLNNVIQETTTATQQIQSAVRQEGAGIEQITAGMNEINQVTSSFVISVKQTIDAMSNLESISKNLKTYVDIL